MRKIQLSLFGVIVLIVAGFTGIASVYGQDNQQGQQKQLLITAEINDGSRVVGAPSTSLITIQTSFAKLDIPWKELQFIEFKDGNETVIIKFRNSDRLTGALYLKSLELKTIFGEVSIGIQQVKKIAVQFAGILSTEGLVAYYPFNGNANDESGNESNGTVNGATLTQDRFGNQDSAYNFDGKDSYIIIKNSSSLNPAKAITLSAWIFSKSVLPGEIGVITKWESGGSNVYSYWYGLCNGIPRFVLSPQKSSGGGFSHIIFDATETLPINEWTHLVALYDGKNMYLYKNGIKIASRPYNEGIYNSPTNVWIGRNSWTGKSFNGIIDEARIYNYALSESEVRELYDIEK